MDDQPDSSESENLRQNVSAALSTSYDYNIEMEVPFQDQDDNFRLRRIIEKDPYNSSGLLNAFTFPSGPGFSTSFGPSEEKFILHYSLRIENNSWWEGQEELTFPKNTKREIITEALSKAVEITRIQYVMQGIENEEN